MDCQGARSGIPEVNESLNLNLTRTLPLAPEVGTAQVLHLVFGTGALETVPTSCEISSGPCEQPRPPTRRRWRGRWAGQRIPNWSKFWFVQFFTKRKQTRCGALTRVRSSPSSPSASRCVVVAGLLTCVRVPVPLSVVRLWCRRHTCAAERVSCRTSHPTPSSSLAPCEHRRRCMPCQTARAET